jgi:hypothetical protein
MAKIKGHKSALAIGLFVAALHAIWAILVAVGIGQAYLNWILPLHFVSSMFTVIEFSFLNALALVIMAFVGGYIGTWLFIWIWNAIKK